MKDGAHLISVCFTNSYFEVKGLNFLPVGNLTVTLKAMWAIGTESRHYRGGTLGWRSVIREPWRIHDAGDSAIRPANPEIQE